MSKSNVPKREEGAYRPAQVRKTTNDKLVSRNAKAKALSAAESAVPANGKQHTIEELATIAELKSMTVDQFTTLVIHNGYTEDDFTKWLDTKLSDCAKPLPLPTPKDERILGHFEKGDAEDVEYQGNKQGMKFLDANLGNDDADKDY